MSPLLVSLPLDFVSGKWLNLVCLGPPEPDALVPFCRRYNLLTLITSFQNLETEGVKAAVSITIDSRTGQGMVEPIADPTEEEKGRKMRRREVHCHN